MGATLIVFDNNKERAEMCAGVGHNFEEQKPIFGSETEKMLQLCEKLFNVSIHMEEGDMKALLKRIYGIAKAHGVYITWYGAGKGAYEPDRFLVSGQKHERLAYIQC